MLPPSVLLPSPFARPPELGLQIVTCVKQHLIWSHRTRRAAPRPLPVSGVSTDRPRRSVFVKKKGACERRAVALAVAIEVIKEGWNCRLWNRARVGERKGGSGKSKHRIIHPSSGESGETDGREAPKKRSPYNLPCGETSISLARSVRHRVISRR